MQALHRLAGVQDAVDLSTSQTDRPNHVAEVPLPPVPSSDREARGSRVGLPLNRKASYKSFKSGRSARSARSHRGAPGIENNTTTHSSQPHEVEAFNTAIPVEYSPATPTAGADPDQNAPDAARASQESRSSSTASPSPDGDEEFVWGPTHPCFPHPNPHCALDSAEALDTRVIRVKRDWLAAGDLYPQYANLYPEILDPLVSDEEFRFVIATLNAQLKGVFDPYSARARFDAVLGVLTGFVWDDVGLAGTKAGMRGVERFLAEWNAERAKQGRAVRVVLVRTTGFMSLDFVVPQSAGVDTRVHILRNGAQYIRFFISPAACAKILVALETGP
nr:ras modification protein erf4 [Quercus suber]